MRLGRLDLAAIVVIAGQLMVAAYIFWFGKTGPLPMHFGLYGQVDRWGDRTQLAALAAGLSTVSAIGYLALPILAGGKKAEGGQLGLAYARASLLAGPALASVMFAAVGAGALSNAAGGQMAARLVMGFLALIIAVIGALVGKAGPNPFVGLRTFWALRSRLAWDRSNRLLGRLMFWLGLIALLAVPLAPQPAGVMAVIAGVLLATLAAGFESWRVWRSDPDRAAM